MIFHRRCDRCRSCSQTRNYSAVYIGYVFILGAPAHIRLSLGGRKLHDQDLFPVSLLQCHLCLIQYQIVCTRYKRSTGNIAVHAAAFHCNRINRERIIDRNRLCVLLPVGRLGITALCRVIDIRAVLRRDRDGISFVNIPFRRRKHRLIEFLADCYFTGSLMGSIRNLDRTGSLFHRCDLCLQRTVLRSDSSHTGIAARPVQCRFICPCWFDGRLQRRRSFFIQHQFRLIQRDAFNFHIFKS